MNRRAVTTIKNYARVQKNFDPAQLANVKEFMPGAYVKDGALWTTLGNTYLIDDLAYPRMRPGRTRRAQSQLNTLVNNAAGQRLIRPARMYHETSHTAFQTYEQAQAAKSRLPDQLYVLRSVRSASNGRPLFALWTAYPE